MKFDFEQIRYHDSPPPPPNQASIFPKVFSVAYFEFVNFAGVHLDWGLSYEYYLVLDGGEWSGSRPRRFTTKERAPSTHWIGGWVGPRAGLDAVVREKIPSPCREMKHPIIRPEAFFKIPKICEKEL
jgi:hypothetical protein